MRVNERSQGHVTIVELVGRFTVVTMPGHVKDAISGLITRGDRHIVLNLANVSYIDSSGLGELVSCYLLAQRHGCTIKLANLDGRMKDVLVLTRLLSLFESHPSEGEAVRSFASAA